MVGDVEPQRVFALAERYFGAIPRGQTPPAVRLAEPPQRAERRVVLQRPGQNPLLQLAYHAIHASDARQPALNLLQTILVGGDASRLHHSLVERQRLAVAIGGGWSEGFDPNVFVLQATLPEDGQLEALQAALDAELTRLLREGVTDAELKRAKNLAAADFWRGVATLDGKARLLGEYTVLHGDHRLLFLAPERYQAVTCAELLAVARTVFAAERRTVRPARAAAGVTGGVKIPPHQRLRLPNGTRLILLPRHDVPLVAVEAVVRGGARLDPAHRAGVASLTAEMLTRGAGGRDAYAFAEAVEGAGGSLDAGAHSEAILMHGQFLARDAVLMLELLADALQRPAFDAHELEGVRERRIEFIKAAKDSEPQSLIGIYGRALLFAGHPFGQPASGSERSLEALTLEDLQQYHARHMGGDRLTLVFAGDFDPQALRAEVTRVFGGWRPAAVPLPPLSAPQRVAGRRVRLIDAPGSAQTYFWIGNTGVARAYPHRAALEITNTAFGGSFGSMLMQTLRVKSGLTYSAGSSFRRGSVPGEFAISSFTETESTTRALTLTLETLDQLKHQGAGATAIDSARHYIQGQYPLHLETAADWAAALADLDLHGLPDGYIDDFDGALDTVDEAQSRRVIDEAFPDSADVDIVLIGDSARIRSEAAQFGALSERALAAPEFN